MSWIHRKSSNTSERMSRTSASTASKACSSASRRATRCNGLEDPRLELTDASSVMWVECSNVYNPETATSRKRRVRILCEMPSAPMAYDLRLTVLDRREFRPGSVENCSCFATGPGSTESISLRGVAWSRSTLTSTLAKQYDTLGRDVIDYISTPQQLGQPCLQSDCVPQLEWRY